MSALEAPASPAAPAPTTLLGHRSFVLFWFARTFTNGAFMMLTVAVGWQLYALTNNPLDLGIIGLVQFVPLVTLVLVVGQVVDRYDRRALIRITQGIKALGAIALAVGSAGGFITREWIFVLMFAIGCARAFEMPAMHAMVPAIVPQSILPRAIAASATAQQTRRTT